KRERARGAGQRDEEREQRGPATQEQGGEREGEPEAVRERGGDHGGAGRDREESSCPDRGRAPGALRDGGERGRRPGHAEDGQQLDPDQRGERVVDEAVADEAITARVPVVRPEREAVLE